METGHFEKKYIDVDAWERVHEDEVFGKFGDPAVVVLKDHPGIEFKLSPFAFYRFIIVEA